MNALSTRSASADAPPSTERFRGLQLRLPSKGKGYTQIVTISTIVDLYFLEELTMTAGIEVKRRTEFPSYSFSSVSSCPLEPWIGLLTSHMCKAKIMSDGRCFPGSI